MAVGCVIVCPRSFPAQCRGGRRRALAIFLPWFDAVLDVVVTDVVLDAVAAQSY
ncbi:hypothetical protein [Arcanobacterium bovis]|uniref:hypothetical protein n=1 Tax=Arcanobacterium bovis TaxID=2529275 RepID=UPI0013F159DE